MVHHLEHIAAFVAVVLIAGGVVVDEIARFAWRHTFGRRTRRAFKAFQASHETTAAEVRARD